MSDDRAALYTRARAICSAQEAVGVERLAIHLAFVATSMPLADARETLKVAQGALEPVFNEKPPAAILPALH